MDRNLKRVERYLNDAMEVAERQRFEEELLHNASLKKTLERVKEIYSMLEDTESIQLRQQLQAIFRKYPGDGQVRSMFPPGARWMMIAAVFVILIGVAAVTIFSIRYNAWLKDPKAFENSAGLFRRDVYTLPPAYADLMKYQIRSEKFTLRQPADSAMLTTKSDIIFKWDSFYDDPLTLEVLNRNGRLVYKSSRPVTSPYLLPTRLNRGAYIVRFRSEHEAVNYSVIFVK